MAAMTTHLDHIVIAAPDLNELVTRFTELTGITPVEGGRHNTGSANALVPLSQPAGSYIELIGPDPEAEKLTEDNFALASSAATEPRVAAWCVRPDDLDDFAADKQVEEMSRITPQGTTLAWKLIKPTPGVAYAPEPFAIDWQNSDHPSTVEEPLARVVKLIVQGAQLPEDLAEETAAVVEAREGEPYLELVLDTPMGEVNLKDI